MLMQAFKTHKVRLYGLVRNIEGHKVFVITGVDPAKKQNKADPKVLGKAKVRALDFAERLGD